MEGAIGAVFGLCAAGWWTGWKCGSLGAQVHRGRLRVANYLDGRGERGCEWADYVKVGRGSIPETGLYVIIMLTESSSAVLWVAQNMEDEYTYNLAL